MNNEYKPTYNDMFNVRLIEFDKSDESITHKLDKLNIASICKIKLYRSGPLNDKGALILIVKYDNNTVVGEVVDTRTQLFRLNKTIKALKSSGVKTDETVDISELRLKTTVSNNLIQIDYSKDFLFTGVRCARTPYGINKEIPRVLNSRIYKERVFIEAWDISEQAFKDLKVLYKVEESTRAYNEFIKENINKFYIKEVQKGAYDGHKAIEYYQITIGSNGIRVDICGPDKLEQMERLSILTKEQNRLYNTIERWLTSDLDEARKNTVLTKIGYLGLNAKDLLKHVIYSYKLKKYESPNTEVNDYFKNNNLECKISKNMFRDIVVFMDTNDYSPCKTKAQIKRSLPYYIDAKPKVTIYGDYVDIEMALSTSYTKSYDEMKKLVVKDINKFIEVAYKLLGDFEKQNNLRKRKLQMAPLNFYKPARYKLLSDYTLIITFDLKVKSEDKEVDALDKLNKK